MLYFILRLCAGLTLRWFYREVHVTHRTRIPPAPTPLLIVVNHPNALVDALIVGWAVSRRITITAKATLFDNPWLRLILRSTGVVPLRRTADERGGISNHTVHRNVQAFDVIIERLKQGGAVLIFPEGRSHDEPALAPLRTGPARIALQATVERQTHGLKIVPIGLIFERKDRPRSRVLVDVGLPIDVQAWVSSNRNTDVIPALTKEITYRLRAVTVNYPTIDEALRTRSLAEILHALLGTAMPIGEDQPLATEVLIERQISEARRIIDTVSTSHVLQRRIVVLLDRLSAFEHRLIQAKIRPDDVTIQTDWAHGIRFTLREAVIGLTIGPIAAWGRLHHWIPFQLARIAGTHATSARDQPAMRTILIGLGLVLTTYGVIGSIAASLLDGWGAALYICSLPVAADIDLRFSERVRRGYYRARAFFYFRRHQGIWHDIRHEHAWLADETRRIVTELEQTKNFTEGASTSAVTLRDHGTDL